MVDDDIVVKENILSRNQMAEYPTKEAKEEALKKMTDEEIDELIKASTNIYGKIFYSTYKKKKA